MIRSLVIFAVAGLILSIVCVAASGAMITRAVTAGSPDVAWWTKRGFDVNMGPGVTIDASGPATTRKIPWSGDDKLTVNLPAEVTFVQASDASVTITGPQSLIDRIDADNGEISLRGWGRDVRWRNGRYHGGHITVEVRAPHVKRFELNGTQKIEIRDYDQDDLRIEANGAAAVEAHGKARALDLQLNGAGKADLAGLTLSSAKIEANGASSVTAGPSESADVEINGVGTVTLLTQPKSLNQSIHGLGKVEIGSSSTVVKTDVSETNTISIRHDLGHGITIEKSASVPVRSKGDTKTSPKGDAKGKTS